MNYRKLRYEECYAKVLLENLFSERYYDLKIEDKPDLIFYPENIGIEVTDCTSEKEREIISLWLKISEQKDKYKQRSIERMEQLGVSYTEGFINWEVKEYLNSIDNSPLEDVLEAVSKKVEKLNKGDYKNLTEYNLFIHSLIFVPENLMQEFFKKLHEINRGKLKFEYIYLSTNENEIICFNMDRKRYDVRKFGEKQYKYAIKAKEIMDGIVNDET